MPNLGYVQIHITFPKNISGKEQQLVILTLVAPECDFNSKILLLIGTNVLLKVYGQEVLLLQHTDHNAAPPTTHAREHIQHTHTQCVAQNGRCNHKDV